MTGIFFCGAAFTCIVLLGGLAYSAIGLRLFPRKRLSKTEYSTGFYRDVNGHIHGPGMQAVSRLADVMCCNLWHILLLIALIVEANSR